MPALTSLDEHALARLDERGDRQQDRCWRDKSLDRVKLEHKIKVDQVTKEFQKLEVSKSEDCDRKQVEETDDRRQDKKVDNKIDKRDHNTVTQVQELDFGEFVMSEESMTTNGCF